MFSFAAQEAVRRKRRSQLELRPAGTPVRPLHAAGRSGPGAAAEESMSNLLPDVIARLCWGWTQADG